MCLRVINQQRLVGWCLMFLRMTHNALQILYEFAFSKMAGDEPFLLYTTFPRVQVPISEEQTISAEQLQGSLVVEFCSDFPDPLSYLCTSPEVLLYNIFVRKTVYNKTL